VKRGKRGRTHDTGQNEVKTTRRKGENNGVRKIEGDAIKGGNQSERKKRYGRTTSVVKVANCIALQREGESAIIEMSKGKTGDVLNRV